MSAKKDSVNESRYEKPEALRLGAVAQGVGQSCGAGSVFGPFCNPVGNSATSDCEGAGNDAAYYCYTGNYASSGCSSDGNTPGVPCALAGMDP